MLSAWCCSGCNGSMITGAGKDSQRGAACAPGGAVTRNSGPFPLSASLFFLQTLPQMALPGTSICRLQPWFFPARAGAAVARSVVSRGCRHRSAQLGCLRLQLGQEGAQSPSAKPPSCCRLLLATAGLLQAGGASAAWGLGLSPNEIWAQWRRGGGGWRGALGSWKSWSRAADLACVLGHIRPAAQPRSFFPPLLHQQHVLVPSCSGTWPLAHPRRAGASPWHLCCCFPQKRSLLGQPRSVGCFEAVMAPIPVPGQVPGAGRGHQVPPHRRPPVPKLQ